MENQKISNRYIKLAELQDLLQRLFGSKYFLEVGQQPVLYSLCWTNLSLQKTDGEHYILQVQRPLTDVIHLPQTVSSGR